MVLQNVVGTHNKHIFTYCMYMVIEHKNHNHHQKRAAQYREHKNVDFFRLKGKCKKGIVKNDFLIAFSTTRCFICLSIYPKCIKFFFGNLQRKTFFIVQWLYSDFIGFYVFVCFSLILCPFFPHQSTIVFFTDCCRQTDWFSTVFAFVFRFCFCYFITELNFTCFHQLQRLIIKLQLIGHNSMMLMVFLLSSNYVFKEEFKTS